MNEVNVEVLSIRKYDYTSDGGTTGIKVLCRLLDEINPDVAGINTKIVDIKNNFLLKDEFEEKLKNGKVFGTLIYANDYFTEKLVLKNIKLD